MPRFRASGKKRDNEPLFEKVIHIVVQSRGVSHSRQAANVLQHRAGFWVSLAWSDTYCINKADHFVLQEALVSMFIRYEGSTVTIVLLRGRQSAVIW